MINMANFLFYKYRFVQTGERSLFSVEDGERVSEEFLNERLAKSLCDKMCDGMKALTLYEFKRDRRGVETSENYVNRMLQCAENVVLLDVRNNKSKTVMPIDKDEQEKVPHHPYTLVVIDVRAGSQAILVQQKKDAFQNPDAVVGLIIDAFTRELGLIDLGWRVDIQKRFCKGSIWDIVKLRTVSGGDRVKSLSLKISEKRPNEDNAVDKALQTVLSELAVSEGELKLMSDDNAKKILDETKEDVRNTVNMLIENNYSMKVGFEKSGYVEYGKKAPAIYGVADKVCDEFRNGTRKFGYNGKSGFDLLNWLDALVPEDETHEYVISDKKKYGRRAK